MSSIRAFHAENGKGTLPKRRLQVLHALEKIGPCSQGKAIAWIQENIEGCQDVGGQHFTSRFSELEKMGLTKKIREKEGTSRKLVKVKSETSKNQVELWGRTGLPFPGHPLPKKDEDPDARVDKDRTIKNQESEIERLKLIIADREKRIRTLEAINPQMNLGF